MTAGRAYFDAVRDELVAAAARERGVAVDGVGAPGPPGDDVARRRRRRTPWMLAAAALVAVVVGVGLVAVDSRRVEAQGIDVITTPTGVLVRFLPGDHTPAELQRELDDAGIDIRVVGVPTGGTLVGDIIGIEAPVDLPFDGIRVDGDTVEIDAGWTGELDVRVGVPAHPGERYVLRVDLLAPGERLHCVLEAGDPVSEVVATLSALDPPVTVTWFAPGAVPGGEAPLDEILAADPDLVLHSLSETADGQVDVVLSEPDEIPATDPSC